MENRQELLLKRFAELLLLQKMGELAYHRQQHATHQARESGDPQTTSLGVQTEFALLDYMANLHAERDALMQTLLEEWTSLEPLEFQRRLEALRLPPIPIEIADLISAGKSY